MKINLFDITASKWKRQHLNSIGQTPNLYFALSQGEPWQSPLSWPVLFSHLIMHPGFVVSLDYLLPLIHGFCALSTPDLPSLHFSALWGNSARHNGCPLVCF